MLCKRFCRKAQITTKVVTMAMEAAYLKKHIGDCLVTCLTEVAEKRPADPIEYIAHWLYKQIENDKLHKKEGEDAEELDKEKKVHEVELKRQEVMKEEAKKLSQEEAAKRKEEEEERAKEAASDSKLPTLVEKEEPVVMETPAVPVTEEPEGQTEETEDEEEKTGEETTGEETTGLGETETAVDTETQGEGETQGEMETQGEGETTGES
ncbi:DPY30 domain-containing protein 1-like isoform X1 [Haliotis asinina]|uniref:DPY30 domain-containing protein 1-like isoform X1 n=2 Tax=Haliotis asinina TaxID=109174 RepID=UPI0035319600